MAKRKKPAKKLPIKLTKVQTEIVSWLLRVGWGEVGRLHHRTIETLLHRKLIKFNRNRSKVGLTARGKQVELD